MPIQYSSSRLSYTHETDFRQERNFGQKVSATFEFMGAHWRPLGRVMLYLVAPLALLQGILTALLQSRMLSAIRLAQPADPTNPLAAQRAMLRATFQNPLYYFNSVLGMIFISMCILTIYGYLVRCLRPVGAEVTPITPGEVWQVVRGHLVGTFFSLWGLTLVIMVGFLVFFFPGVYLSVALSLFFIVRVVEGTGFFGTIGRCLRLTKGKWWSTFGVIFIMIVLLYALLFGLNTVLGMLIAGLHGAFTPTTPGQASDIFAIVMAVFLTVAFFLLYPPLLLVLAFQYFNLVERHEAVGLLHLVGQLGQAPLASPDGSTYRPQEEGEY
ncbi:hypothetical protein [Hymenobacter cheonanensis]|uniref:hypothetical protein n=1 Tax=Hymenobacter sp. CA2-7 TaxID=3063993 RepID=UPI00271281FA|nr:hypothetical protein [Hymenobacter sp. CA2-7]MDO7885459.1 hypothetical protein [Hymenobacter sp. CA2-7]